MVQESVEKRHAVLLLREGAEVVLYDGNDKLDREEILSKIPESGNGSLQILLGTLADEKKAQLLKTLDLVVMSPGVPTDLPIVNEMRDRGIPIWGEIELAYEAGKGEVLAITGNQRKDDDNFSAWSDHEELYREYICSWKYWKSLYQ